jgi:hypothetical protein
MMAVAVPRNRRHFIGDRRRGETPHSSDGVVAYWNSHIDDFECEKIVLSGQGANRNHQDIAEVDRILKEHLGSKGS